MRLRYRNLERAVFGSTETQYKARDENNTNRGRASKLATGQLGAGALLALFYVLSISMGSKTPYSQYPAIGLATLFSGTALLQHTNPLLHFKASFCWCLMSLVLTLRNANFAAKAPAWQPRFFWVAGETVISAANTLFQARAAWESMVVGMSGKPAGPRAAWRRRRQARRQRPAPPPASD